MDHETQTLLDLFNQGHYAECEQYARELIASFPDYGFAWKVLGVLLRQQGRQINALEAMQTAAELLPTDAEAHSNLGVMLMNSGLLNDAVESYRKALELNPNSIEICHLLGLTLSSLGQLVEAEDCYQRVLALNADYVDAQYHLGRIYQQQGRLKEAEQCYRRVLETHGHLSEVHSSLANVLHWQGQTELAEHYYRSALAINAQDSQAQKNLALLLQTQGRFSEAKQYYENALSLQPEFAELYNNLGIVCHELGLAEQAQQYYQQALTLKPDFFEAYNNLGLSLQARGCIKEAEAAYRKAVSINPNNSETYNNLGIVFQASGQWLEATASYQRALTIKPKDAQIHYNLGVLHQELHQYAQAEAQFRAALAIKPDYALAYSHLLWLMTHQGRSAADCLAVALQYGQCVAVSQPFSEWQCETQPERLRIGLVFGDLSYRATKQFFCDLLPELDASSLELFAYSLEQPEPELIGQLQPYFATWRVLSTVNDETAATLIHNDAVHILLDLTGHSPRNRLAIFAWQAAPIQVSWLGALTTTGLNTMTYLLSDVYTATTDNAAYCSETIWQLPDSYRCFNVPNVYLETEDLPVLTETVFTFGCFQPLSCITEQTIRLWATVLHTLPNAKLLLKNAQLNDANACQTLHQQFADVGILPERLLLEGSRTQVERLAAYRYVDIALDTFPETGYGSIEAIWMAVPVLTLAGETLISRCGASIAHHVGLSEWVATDEQDFVAKAVYFSRNIDHLVQLRRTLREQLLNSPLFDLSGFARNFEAALWSMYNA